MFDVIAAVIAAVAIIAGPVLFALAVAYVAPSLGLVAFGIGVVAFPLIVSNLMMGFEE